MTKKKAKCKLCPVSRREIVKQGKAIGKLCADVDKVAGQLSDSRRSNRALVEANERMLRQLSEQRDLIDEMHREVYALVKCLNATREKWQEAEDKVRANTQTYRIETAVGRPRDGCDSGERSVEGSGTYVAAVQVDVDEDDKEF